ncbi:thioredoxin family protein [Falsibacillus albus]|uniref:Thioredoxin n=1 Tax=Falsibacillus albus TaxID=2478915 RepID=A0A3L7JX38_9BACI|nr:thioredoxin family protein [Falsibacillus albus]RLQ94844.1 thioredoxin [Falsibacillus albus]
MKKILLIFFSTALLFGFGSFYFNGQTKGSDIYGKKNLHPETVKQLNDPNYQNIIQPKKLLQQLKRSNEDTFVYFYSSSCKYCKETTPIMVSVSRKLNITVYKYNLLEFEDGWGKYNIVGTPTLVKFRGDKEIKRIEGLQDKDEFKKFFSK